MTRTHRFTSHKLYKVNFSHEKNDKPENICYTKDIIDPALEENAKQNRGIVSNKYD